MNTPTETACREILLTCDGLGSARKAEALNQIIADREAKAVKPYVEQLKAADDSRAEMVGICDQLRAENERLVAQRDNLLKPMRDAAVERAEKAEAELLVVRRLLLDSEEAGTIANNLRAELATERARLDWLEKNTVSIYCAGLYEGTNAAVCIPNGKDHKGATIRIAIDAAMEES